MVDDVDDDGINMARESFGPPEVPVPDDDEDCEDDDPPSVECPSIKNDCAMIIRS